MILLAHQLGHTVSTSAATPSTGGSTFRAQAQVRDRKQYGYGYGYRYIERGLAWISLLLSL